MKPITTILLAFLLSIMDIASYAQNSNVQNLLYTRKDKDGSFGKKNDFMPDEKAFYLYRNCFYNFVFKNKLEVRAKIIDIKNDSIYYTEYINASAAEKARAKLDTLSVHPSDIKRIRLIADRIMGLFTGSNLNKYNYRFVTSDSAKRFTIWLDTVYARDSSYSTIYEVIPYMTAQGLDRVYEQCGKTYYYEGITAQQNCEDTAKKPYIRKKGVWFTPSKANEIRGVNFSLQVIQWDDGPLSIHGVNLGAEMLSFFGTIYGLFMLGSGNALINMPDTIDAWDTMVVMNGVSISAGGYVGGKLKGVSINGGISVVNENNGLSITGTQNINGEFKGVVIGGIRNKAIKGKGAQIGLFNICKHMKGIQIGLWNVNSKRKLPFINWSF